MVEEEIRIAHNVGRFTALRARQKAAMLRAEGSYVNVMVYT